jgi:hypothetical protein
MSVSVVLAGNQRTVAAGQGWMSGFGSKAHGLRRGRGDGDSVWCGVCASLLLPAIATCYTLLGAFFHFFLW